MKKKIFLTILMIALCMCLFAICASAATAVGDKENGYVWYDLSKNDTFEGYDGTATVSTANRTDTDTENYPKATEVVIPEILELDTNGDGTVDERYVVTAVASEAFGMNGSSSHPLVSITIPRTVRSIGVHAFRKLQNLQTVVINASGYNPVTGEDRTAEIKFSNAEFWTCPELLSVDMSKSNVTQVGDNCFTNCSKLHTVLFSSNIKKITAPFTGCSSLTTISSLESLETLGSFYGSKITGDIKLYNITSMGTNAFRDTCVTSVDFTGAPITALPERAFENCTTVTSVVLPEGLKSVGYWAFKGASSLSNMNIPRGIERLEDSAFWGPTFSGDIVLDNLEYMGPHAFRGTQIRSLVIKGTLTSLNTDAAFYGCSKLEYLVLPDSVTTSGDNTFTNCNALKYIVCSDAYVSVTSKPANASLIVRGTNYEAMSAWGWEAVPFSQYDPNSSSKNKIFYGAIATDDPTVLADFTGFDKSFGTWDATTNEKTSYDAVVEVLGYSKKNGGTGIATGFKVNQASVDAYKAIFGGDINFGIVIFNPSFIGDTFFDAEGKINAEKGAIQVELVENYSTLSASVAGFDLSNEAHQKLELVFAGYAYTKADKSDIDLFQKEYVGTQENPVSSPMQSKVVKGDDVLYTVKLQTVTTPVNITTGKDGLNAFGA